ncbi:ribbon-helix-helix protein, CopG family [Thiomicrorhabdus sp. Milos-T2]|uniref:type II toxin-antitoxin system RelB family antitoxin n=1 Tax=Thiomicrorhabdus sp. Milos-T2 TaxID=90814 RepID=UPI0004942ABF|nr:ribbon-helix-helix domain-containing protein [Thiomicrorhabdus sp. Milos-T2]
MLSVRLDSDTEKFLETLANETHRSKSFFVKEALKNYREDMEDYYEAQVRSKDEKRNLISVEELEKSLGL